MNQSRSTLLGMPALLLIALLLTRSYQTIPPPAPPQNGQALVIRQEPTEASLLLKEFFTGVADPDAPVLEAARKGWVPRYLIVMIPDPREGRHDYLYDREMSSLQRAAEACGFVLDRVSLPWFAARSTAVGEKADKMPKAPSGVGAMVFRGSADETERQVLVVLVVTETVARGVDKVALVGAMREVSTSTSPAPETLAILGPTFSGSLASLEHALGEFYREAQVATLPKIQLISGSATAIDPARLEHFAPLVSYSSTVASDKVALDAILGALLSSPFDARPGEVAIVTEADTVYGRQFEAGAGGSKVLHIRFPLHVSGVRDASDRSRGGSGLPGGIPDLAPSNRVPLSLSQGDGGSDPGRPISKLEDASTELTLSNLIKVLDAESYRYVGLAVSDIRDAIFLAREIREQCPNTVLFTLNPDVLFLHSSVNRSFLGALTISTYPLTSRNQAWSYPFDGASRRLIFPDHYSEGTYNAALALLGRSDLMLDYARPFSTEKKDRKHPPLWLSVVGRDGFWPLRLIDAKDPALKSRVPPPERNPDNDVWRGLHPRAFSILFALLNAAVLAVALALGRRSPWESLSGTVYSREADPDLWNNRTGHRFAVAMILLDLSFFSTACLVMLRRVQIAYGGGSATARLDLLVIDGALILAGIPALLVCAAAAFACLRSCRVPGRRFGLLDAVVPPVNFFSLVIGILALVTSLDWALRPDTMQVLFSLERMTHLRSGISPLLPVVFVALAGLVYGWYSLRRLRAIEGLVGLTLLEFGNSALGALKEHEERIRGLMKRQPTRLPLAWAVWLIFMWGLVWDGPRALTNYESAPYGMFVMFAYAVMYMSVLLSGLREVLVWTATKSMLEVLSRQRIAGAFFSSGQQEKLSRDGNLHGSRRSLPILADSIALGHRAAYGNFACPALAAQGAGQPWYLDAARLQLVRDSLDRAGQTLREAVSSDARSEWREELQFRRDTQRELGIVSAHLAEGQESLQARLLKTGPCPPCDDARAAGEQYIVSRVIDLLHDVFTNLRYQATNVTIGLLLMLLAAGCYPFPERDRLLLINWLVIGTLVAVSVGVLVQINRNAILSALNGTTPNRVSWDRDFLVRIALHGLLPLLALLGAQFPSAFGSFMPWLTGLLTPGR